MPVHRYDRTGRRLSPCLATLLNEMVIPPFKVPNAHHNRDAGFSRYPQPVATPSLADLPTLDHDSDADSRVGSVRRTCHTRVNFLTREECTEHPLSPHESHDSCAVRLEGNDWTCEKFDATSARDLFEPIPNNQDRVIGRYDLPMQRDQRADHGDKIKAFAGWFKDMFSSPYNSYGARETQAIRMVRNTNPNRLDSRVMTSTHQCTEQQLKVFSVTEIPIRKPRPRLARANGDFLRIYALENSMRLSGKLREPSASMILEPRRTLDDFGEILGISIRIDSRKVRQWRDLSDQNTSA